MSKLLNKAKQNAAASKEPRPTSPDPQVLEGRQSPTPANESRAMKSRAAHPRVIKWLANAPRTKPRKPRGPWEAVHEIEDMSPNELHISGYGVPEANGQIPFQPRRSLDQYTYSRLENTATRDEDQVVYRYTNNPENLAGPKIFMVDQMWMWLINGGTDGPYTAEATCTDLNFRYTHHMHCHSMATWEVY